MIALIINQITTELKFKTVINKNTFYFHKRVITLIRITDNSELNTLVYKDKWFKDKNIENIKEWLDQTIFTKIKSNKYFRKGIVNIFLKVQQYPF